MPRARKTSAKKAAPRRVTKPPPKRAKKSTPRKMVKSTPVEPDPKLTKPKARERYAASAEMALSTAGTTLRTGQQQIKLGRCDLGMAAIGYAERLVGRAEAMGEASKSAKVNKGVVHAQAALTKVKTDFAISCAIQKA